MPGGSSLELWVVSSEGTLGALDRPLARRGVKVRRLVTLRFEDANPKALRARVLQWGRYDTLIVTSPRAVSAFVRPVLVAGKGPPPHLETWAVGPATARALHALGFRSVRRPAADGSRAIAARFAGGRTRSILYPRSDRAGSELGRRLRRQGHRVLDPVAYRTIGVIPSASAMNSLSRPRTVVLATSPSALSSLRAAFSPRAFIRWRRTARLIALGQRTARSARGHGFREVISAPELSVEGLTALLVREARDGPR